VSFIFIDTDEDAIEKLKVLINQESDLAKDTLPTLKFKFRFIVGRFEDQIALMHQIVAVDSHQSAFFVLDQYGYSNVDGDALFSLMRVQSKSF